MRCMACGDDHWEGSECPRCHFPVYEILGNELESSMAQIRAFAEEHRKEYLSDLQLGVVTYRWEERDGTVQEADSSVVYFTTGGLLREGEYWYPQKLARIPEKNVLSVTVALKKGNQERRIPVEVENLKESELQQVGFRLEDELQIRLLLKNDSAQKESQLISVCI